MKPPVLQALTKMFRNKAVCASMILTRVLSNTAFNVHPSMADGSAIKTKCSGYKDGPKHPSLPACPLWRRSTPKKGYNPVLHFQGKSSFASTCFAETALCWC